MSTFYLTDTKSTLTDCKFRLSNYQEVHSGTHDKVKLKWTFVSFEGLLVLLFSWTHLQGNFIKCYF